MKIPVTLVAVDGRVNNRRTIASLKDAASKAQFAEVVFCGLPPDVKTPGDWRMAATRPMTKHGYNVFCLRELHNYINTSHALTIQDDSRIVNAEAWDDKWLNYDYIGAPWPDRWTKAFSDKGFEYRVGNSGFCLRSKRLLEATAKLPTWPTHWHGRNLPICVDDVITCCMYRESLERAGMRFAPVSVATKFAFEKPTKEAPALNGQFGQHKDNSL